MIKCSLLGKLSYVKSFGSSVTYNKGTKNSSPTSFSTKLLTIYLSAHCLCKSVKSFNFNHCILAFKVLGFFKSKGNPCICLNFILRNVSSGIKYCRLDFMLTIMFINKRPIAIFLKNSFILFFILKIY